MTATYIRIVIAVFTAAAAIAKAISDVKNDKSKGHECGLLAGGR